MGPILDRCKGKQYDCPLHNAILKGDTEKVEILLCRNAIVNFRNEFGMFPLHYAALVGSLEIVKSLLSKGANIDSTTEDGVTALHIACNKGFTEIVDYILNFGATVNVICTSKENNGYYPLHHAVSICNREIVKLLLNYGADVDCIEANGKTSLHLAVDRGHLEIVEDLLMFGACTNYYSSSSREESLMSLPIDVKNFNEEIALEYNVNDTHYTSLPIEVKNLNEVYLDFDTNVNDSHVKIMNKSSLLHIAVKNGLEEIANLLINHGANLNALDEKEKTPMHYAIENGSLKLTKLLLNCGFRIKGTLELLDISARKGNMEIVECILKSDIDIKASDETGRTVLHFSVLYDNWRITKLVLSKGADVNRKQADGVTALHIAAGNGSKYIVRTLLEHGAEVHCIDKRDRTPLHQAAGGYNDYGEVVQILLQHGADVNFRDSTGKTALHIASRKQHVQAVKELLKYDANFNVIDIYGNTALDCAFVDRYSILKAFCVLAKHVDKVKASDLFVNEGDLELIESVSYLYSFYTKYDRNNFPKACQDEVERMRCERINDNVSFYDFLTKDINQIVLYTRNENIIQVLELGDYKKRYPIYGINLENRLRIGKQKRDLLDLGEKSLIFLVKITVPHLVVEEIFKYLNESDVRGLIRASEKLATNCNYFSVMKKNDLFLG